MAPTSSKLQPNLSPKITSAMTKGFSEMTNIFLQSAIESEPLPPHAELITSMSIKSGGLGLQHPRTCAVAQFMLTTKRCLQYCHHGVWLSYNKPRPALPPTITHLFVDWKTNSANTSALSRRSVAVPPIPSTTLSTIGQFTSARRWSGNMHQR